jgi:hypothetical protein
MSSVGRSLGLERQRRGADADDCSGRRPGAARALAYRRAGEAEQAHIAPPLAAASLTEHGPRSPVATTTRSWPRLTSTSAGLCRRRALPTRRLLLVRSGNEPPTARCLCSS